MFGFSNETLVSRFKIAVPLFLVSFCLTFVDFSLIWRYFALFQLVIATIVLYSATVYLIRRGKLYIVSFLPAVVCTLISFAYVFQSSECLGLPSLLSNVLAVVLTVVIGVLFIGKYG